MNANLRLEKIPKLDFSFDITHFVMLGNECIGLVREPPDADGFWAEAYEGGMDWELLPHPFLNPQTAAVVLARRKLYGPASRQVLIRQRN